MIDPRVFRTVMGCFATGIAVATTRGKNSQPRGITINSLTSVSLDPPLVLFCLSKTAHVRPAFRSAPYFAFNILAEGQESLSRHFAGPQAHVWDDVAFHDSAQTCPILDGNLGWLACKRHKIHDGGDHDIIVGEVVELHHHRDADPLLYFRGKYRRLSA